MTTLRMLIIAVYAIIPSLLAAVAKDDNSIINTLVYSPRLEELAEEGNAYAQNNLGVVYQKGSGVEVDLQKAVYWFQRGAEGGNGKAMSNLGVAYLKGYGVERNIPLAAEWIRKSAITGEQSGYFNLATLYYNGIGMEKDYDMALHYAHAALEAKDVDSYTEKSATLKSQNIMKGKVLMFLALCYREGVGTAPDMMKSFEYMRLAANNGNPEGSLMMSQAYEKGENVEKSLIMAERCYVNAAEGGYFQAQYILGSRYFSGEVFKKDNERAVKYLSMVLDNKKEIPPMVKADAMLKLADLLEITGDNDDLSRAAELRGKAAALPAPDAAKIHTLIFD